MCCLEQHRQERKGVASPRDRGKIVFSISKKLRLTRGNCWDVWKISKWPYIFSREKCGLCGEGAVDSYELQLRQQYKWLCRDFRRRRKESKYFLTIIQLFWRNSRLQGLKKMDKVAFCWRQPAAMLLGKAGWKHTGSTNVRYLGHISMHVTSPAGIKSEGSECGS